jgi:hypothetical protein
MTLTAPELSNKSQSQGQLNTAPPLQIEPVKLSGKQAQQIANLVNEQYQKMKTARSSIERQWYLNMAFYFGKQNVVPQTVKGVGSRLVTPPAPPWRVRMVVNRIRPIIRKEIAKLTSQKPSASVVPATADDMDLFAAQAAEQIWESMYYTKDIKMIVKEAAFWMLVCGTGYIKTYWDDNVMAYADPNNPDPSQAYQGDICYASETPFHVLVPDLRQIHLERQPFLIHSSTRTPEWLATHYQKTLDGQPIKPNTKSANEILNDAFLNLVGGSTYDYDSVLIHEMHIKPGGHPMFPDGALITITGDQVIQFSPHFPYSHGQYCFSKLDHIPSGKFYATSAIEDLIPIQREYNRTRSQIVEAKNRMAKPQMSAQMGSLDVSRVTSEPGQFILYKMGFQPPQPIPMQGLPAYVMNEVQQLQLDFDDISGQHEVGRGQVPTGVTAATAISFLQEQDDSMLSAEVDSIESAMEKVAKHTLCLAAEYWDIPRLVKIVGVDGSWDAAMFKGSDLRGNTDIRIEAGSALPTSKAAKQALITDWMKMGFIDPEKGMEVLEMGGITQLYENVKVDQAQARRENLKMANIDPQLIQQMFMDPETGQPAEPAIDPATGRPLLPVPAVPVNSWDNHAIHIDVHNKFRKGQDFERLDPMHQLLFEIHVQKHMEAIAAPHIGGPPTSEMMIGIAEQQRNQPPPTDVNTPMQGDQLQPPDQQMQDAGPPGPIPGPDSEQQSA